MSASKIPPDKGLPRPTPAEGVTTTPAEGAAATPARPRLPPTIRAGMGDVTTEYIEIHTDEEERQATGLVSILGPEGKADPARVPAADVATWRAIYLGMLRIRRLDERLVALARSGRIGAYVDARGEEAAIVAPLATLAEGDWVVPSHREGGAALYRGMSVRSYVAHAFGNAHDLGKGRRAPAQPVAPRRLNVMPTSATSATKLPQATGLAWAAKIKKEPTVVLAYLDEAATSAEDFHTGINFAAVFRVPAVFVCVNGGWSVSTPASAQTGAASFAVKALAYGMPGIRVDGNDPLAVFDVVRAAVARARRGEGPTLIEAVTYRLGGFSPEDDGAAYRDAAEVEAWRGRDPLLRFSRWLRDTAALDDLHQARMTSELDAELDEAIAVEADVGPPALDSLIEDIYLVPPTTLVEQLADLKRIRAKR